MRAWSTLALFISGASGDTTRCAAGPGVAHAHCEGAQPGDSASLLQLKALERVQGESGVVEALRSASSTRRCTQGAYSPVMSDCEFGDWSDWGGCSKTCGSGERSRTRELSGTCDGQCSEEAEKCSSEVCPFEPVGPPEECPPGTERAWGDDCPGNGVSAVMTGRVTRDGSEGGKGGKDGKGAEETVPRVPGTGCCVPTAPPTREPLPPATSTTTTTEDEWGDEWGDSGGEALRPQLVKEEALCGPKGELLTSNAGDISDCGALAEGAGYRAFAFGIKVARGRCYAMTLHVDDALCDEWDKNRANPRCPEGEWKHDGYFDFYALETAWLD